VDEVTIKLPRDVAETMLDRFPTASEYAFSQAASRSKERERGQGNFLRKAIHWIRMHDYLDKAYQDSYNNSLALKDLSERAGFNQQMRQAVQAGIIPAKEQGETLAAYQKRALATSLERHFSQSPEVSAEARPFRNSGPGKNVGVDLVQELHKAGHDIDLQTVQQHLSPEDQKAFNCHVASLEAQGMVAKREADVMGKRVEYIQLTGKGLQSVSEEKTAQQKEPALSGESETVLKQLGFFREGGISADQLDKQSTTELVRAGYAEIRGANVVVTKRGEQSLAGAESTRKAAQNRERTSIVTEAALKLRQEGVQQLKHVGMEMDR
jgi:hypothetical protein